MRAVGKPTMNSNDQSAYTYTRLNTNDNVVTIGDEGTEICAKKKKKSVAIMGRISFSGYKLFIFIRIPVCRCYCFQRELCRLPIFFLLLSLGHVYNVSISWYGEIRKKNLKINHVINFYISMLRERCEIQQWPNTICLLSGISVRKKEKSTGYQRTYNEHRPQQMNENFSREKYNNQRPWQIMAE